MPITTALPKIKDPLKTEYTPEQINIAPEDEIQSRIANIVGGGGPLQQVSDTQAAQLANQRGLLNTSMAVGAAEKARIETAFPIASQEAQLSFAAQQANQQATNQARSFGAGFFQNIGLAQEQGAQQRLGFTAAADAESGLMAQKADIDKQLLTASADEQLRLIVQKGEIDTALQELRGTQAVAQIETSGEVQSRLQAEGAEISEQLITAEGQTKLDLIIQQGEISSQLQEELFKINEQLASGAVENEVELLQIKADLQTELQKLIGSQALERQGLAAEHSLVLQRLEGDYQTLINTQRSAAVVFSEISSSISQILANPDIPSGAKQGLISYQLSLLQTSLAVMGSISDMDLVGLLDFGGGSVPLDGVGPIESLTLAGTDEGTTLTNSSDTYTYNGTDYEVYTDSKGRYIWRRHPKLGDQKYYI